jgi:hypothetical protein
MPKGYSSGMRAVFDHADDPLAPMYVAHAAGPHKRSQSKTNLNFPRAYIPVIA